VIAPARLAAYDVLRAVSTRRSDLPAALVRARGHLPDERDRALAGEIATGTLRWQGTFDVLIAAYARRPLDTLDGEVVDILRLTLFQLLHLDRVPASAAVNDAVQMTRKAGKSSAAAFVNALLRRASRERGRLPLPPRTPGTAPAEIGYLEQSLSHPRWLVERWHSRYGFEAAEAWCRFDNTPAPLTLRANRLRVRREELAEALRQAGVETQPARFAPDGLVVTSGNPLLSPIATQGLFAVQDEASQIVGDIVQARPGERILDACAAPGGKTIAMAAGMENRGMLVAADVRARRVGLLSDTVRAAGATCARIVQANAAEPLPFGAIFDCVLVDAPCTGLGTLRRDPDIKWRRTGADFESVTALQLRILAAAAAAIRPGGRIIYATCSSEPDEDEDVVARFLESQPGFRPVPLQFDPAPGLINSAGHLRTLPFRDALEGFFAAAVVKADKLG
jgi:16S rRNA (cytosine967-C5)-methyltransferase